MDPAQIAKLILAGAELAKAVAPIVSEGIEIFGEEDQTKIKAALGELQAANDVLHARVQAKLRG